MASGAFSRFDHDHKFKSCALGTAMTDVFDWAGSMYQRFAEHVVVEPGSETRIEPEQGMLPVVPSSGVATKPSGNDSVAICD